MTPVYFFIVWADALHQSQQCFSHDGMFPSLSYYNAEDKVSYSMTQHSASSEA